ncbi:hypothetical protein FB45DRAFT_940085 [Roridomyces roridus]|uniref:Uncharacterized protein n=1 Tax=Roridomyces roridus TaxID=1738132 RepID=A0AAD7B6M0_9AGAR|nr:hypothetical protein FB45DRAFT_940085 [Roridomyces roridus]
MPPKPFDVKQVAKLFDDTLSQVRAQNGNLHGDAVNWLKDARKAIMRDIEKEYYVLAQSVANPLSRPAWADGVTPLTLLSSPIPPALNAYTPAFTDNLTNLLVDCGFKASARPFTNILINIVFPAPPPMAARGKPPVVPKTMEVEDEFSKFSKKNQSKNKKLKGGEDEDEKKPVFMAEGFGRILSTVREGTKSEAPENSSLSSVGKKRGRAAVKQEEDTDGRRLRSATRASSTATVRASTRKRVKLA